MARNFNNHFDKQVKPHLEKLHQNAACFGSIDRAREKMNQVYETVQPQLSKNWESLWIGRSLLLKNSKLRVTVKMTATNEVFVDRRVGVHDFKSDKYVFKTLEETVEKFQQVLTPFLKPLDAFQAA